MLQPMSSDTTRVVQRSASQPAVATSVMSVVEAEGDVVMEEGGGGMDQDDEDGSLDSEEDGLRQLLLLQQTRY